MNVYDTANRLASEIKTSQEYLDFKQIKQEVENTPELKQKLEEFEKLRYDTQIESIQGKEPTKEEVEKMHTMYAMLIQQPKIKEYFDKQLKFNVLLTDINKIIGESVKDLLG